MSGWEGGGMVSNGEEIGRGWGVREGERRGEERRGG